MSGIKDQHEIDELEKRLYERGTTDSRFERRGLSDVQVPIATDWAPASTPQKETPAEPTQKRGYRKVILIGSIVFFILVAAASAAFFFWDGNRISGENINFTISGPATVGGSETMQLQVSITNQNTVTVESAVLVMRYPEGTRAVDGDRRNLFETRVDIGTIAPGEVKNIPVQVAMYGKENEDKKIEATLEYRIEGSNGSFFKTAEPHSFRITSSPVTLQATSLGRVAAGQEVEVVLTVRSNTSRPIQNLVLSASYPNGFSFSESTPQPVFNQNTWRIDELLPDKSASVRIRGVITGQTEERFAINFTAGVAQADNQFIVGSLLAETRSEFVIERPFIAVKIEVNGESNRTVILERGRTTPVDIEVKNTLDEAVFDMAVEVVPGGNALAPESITTQSGFFDSNRQVVRFDVTNNQDFATVGPQETRRLRFNITPPAGQTAAAFDLTVNVLARRLGEASAQEQLIGTVSAEGRYASEAFVGGQINHMSGPLPPRVGQATTYLVTLVAEAGANDLANVTVNTSLPTYMTWLNDFSGPGSLDYNPVNKQIEWRAGDMRAGTRRELVFSVSFLPSASQAGITPVLINRQTLRTVDKFTNAQLTTTSEQIFATLSREAGYDDSSGIVQR